MHFTFANHSRICAKGQQQNVQQSTRYWPDPATPTVAAPAPINLAAESISLVTGVVWKLLTAGRSVGCLCCWTTELCTNDGFWLRVELSGLKYTLEFEMSWKQKSHFTLAHPECGTKKMCQAKFRHPRKLTFVTVFSELKVVIILLLLTFRTAPTDKSRTTQSRTSIQKW